MIREATNCKSITTGKVKLMHETTLNLNIGNWTSRCSKRYFDKQIDNAMSDKAKDKQFKSFIANYKSLLSD